MYQIVLVFVIALWCSAAPLRLEPDGISMSGPGASQKVVVAPGCAVSSLDPAVAFESGELRARTPGEARIRLACGGQVAQASVRVGDKEQKLEVSFGRAVMSILTTKGCNSSSCHGSPAGQSGFKLSLYAGDPAADREMMVAKHDGRRVNLANPEASLLLRKPTLQIAHGGGQLMTPQSDEYRTLLEWLRGGAKGDAGGPKLKAIEMYPREKILVGTGVKQALAVIGRLSDGTTLDLTNQVRYAVADQAVVGPVQDGGVVSKGRGLTVVAARAYGLAATSQFIVIDRAAGTDYPRVEPNNFIDQGVFSKLRDVNLAPFPLGSDRVFVRRVYLDTIGVLPTPDETEAFAKDTRTDKRARLIDNLLERDGYSLHWLAKLEDWFRNSQYYSQGRTNGSYKRWLRELLEQDRPYDEAVREMLTATGDTTVRPAGNFWHPAIDFMLKTFDVTKATPTVTRLFLGQRIECAECHNHPLENLTQDDYYGMAAFFGRLKVKHGYGQYRRIWYATREGEVTHPVTKKPVPPKLLDGTVPDIPDNVDRRQVLADWITRNQQVQFARATVNRVWAEYFAAGIVEPADDFRSTNMPTHPELLDKLAAHFIDNGFRFKALHRAILNSKTYQLASHTEDRPGGTDPLERLLLARYEPRKLPAEVLLDSVVQVTGVPQSFGNYPAGTSPKELIASIGATYFLTTFGFPRRDIMERRSESPSLAQALHLMNSDSVKEKVENKDNSLAFWLARHSDDRPVLDSLYLAAYSRPATDAQWAKVEAYLEAEKSAGRTRRRAFENVVWAVLNSKEFQLNQ